MLTKEQEHKEYVNSLPLITYNEFIEKDKTEDLCFEIADGNISDDLEDYFSELDYVVTKDEVITAIRDAKNIEIYKKERYKLPKGLILEDVSSYLEDNFGYNGYELGYLDDMIGSEVFEQCESKINEYIKGWYTTDKVVYRMDASKEVEEYLKEELGEDYPEV